MRTAKRSGVVFVASCASFFVLACIATAQAMIRLIGWYLGNCSAASSRCSAADWFISYWWLPFILCTLLATVLVHRIYVKRRPRQLPDARSQAPS